MLEKDHGEILSWKRRVRERQNVDAHCGYEILKPAGTALRALARAGGVRTPVATAAPATAPTSATST